ncbi:MAG: hypothetical protein K0Q66_2475 [Chitinophagaceae bacterium]|jgi:hypothetical protein|nr:hypothetical protein [Chitinophagaceae bacterium]
MRKLLVLVVLAAFISCEPKKDPVAPSLSVTNANVAGSYKITAATASMGGFTQDVYNNASVFPPCQKDDVHTLTTGGAYTVVDGAVTCSPSTNYTGTYTVNTAANTITLGTQTCNVIDLTATTIVVSQPNFMGSSVTVTATYTKQ